MIVYLAQKKVVWVAIAATCVYAAIGSAPVRARSEGKSADARRLAHCADTTQDAQDDDENNSWTQIWSARSLLSLEMYLLKH